MAPMLNPGHCPFVRGPGEENVRMGAASVIGKLCVIGAQIDEKALAALFGV